MTDSNNVKRVIVGVLILILIFLTALIIKPIVMPILFGLLSAYIFFPLYIAIKSKIKNKRIATSLLVVGLSMIIIVPAIYLIPSVINQSFNTYVSIQNLNMAQVIRGVIDTDYATTIGVNIDNFIGQMFTVFLSQFTAFIVNIPTLIFQLAVFLFTFFFATKDASQLKGYVYNLSPFSNSTEKKILSRFRGITNAIIFGQIFVGILQGLVLGVGIFSLGIPRALILTLLACVVSILPILGSWLLWIPLSIYLLANGQLYSGLFLLVYGAFSSLMIENMTRQYVFSKRSNMPIAISVIGTIGGLSFFGIAGLILGPLILAYMLIVIELYKNEKLNDLFKNKNEIKN
jgi:predicted PurR-regulated permease PerM